MTAVRTGLTFSRSWSEDKGISYYVKANDTEWNELAVHLTASNLEATAGQLEILTSDHDVRVMQQQWAALSPTPLEVGLDQRTLKIGETIISIAELKDVLQRWLEHLQPFDHENEARKLTKYLMLPVDGIHYDDRFPLDKPHVDEEHQFIKLRAKLYMEGSYIGEIPYILSHFGPMFDTGERGLIDWRKIAELFGQQWLEVIKCQDTDAVSIEGGDYGIVSIKDVSGKITGQAFCQFVNEQWQIVIMDPNSQTQTKTVEVILSPPPFEDGNQIV